MTRFAQSDPGKAGVQRTTKPEYSFKGGKRGRVIPEQAAEPGKSRITIWLDDDVLERFLVMADETGNGYQTLINAGLREYLDGKAPKFEDTLRRILREELGRDAASCTKWRT